MTRNRAMANSTGPVADSTSGRGRMASSTGRESTSTRTESRRTVSGRTARGSTGSQNDCYYNTLSCCPARVPRLSTRRCTASCSACDTSWCSRSCSWKAFATTDSPADSCPGTRRRRRKRIWNLLSFKMTWTSSCSVSCSRQSRLDSGDRRVTCCPR